MNYEILHRENMHYGGFAGLREHRLVMGRKIFGFHAEPKTWDGIGNFVYLADAKFNPHGQTNMHPHHEIDVISVMVEGNIKHEGSLEHGEFLSAGDVQIQRAGGEGFKHNEINPDGIQNRMLQLWVLPEKAGEPASYKLFKSPKDKITTIYGGDKPELNPFPAQTVINLVQLKSNEKYTIDSSSLVYVFQGSGESESKNIEDGDLLRGSNYEISSNRSLKFLEVKTLN